MALGYVNPGGAFSSAFEDAITQHQLQQRQLMLQDLAMKREQRLAQAELDSAKEHQDALAEKRQKDTQDAHDRAVKQFKESVDTEMVPGDRPSPEQIQKAQALGLSIFRQAPPAMSTQPMQPPAALMPNAPAGAPEEGAPAPTPQGAMAPGPLVFPGTAVQRQKEQNKADVAAFVQRLRDAGEGDKADEVANAFEAEGLGLKSPAGMFSKSTSATKHRVVFDPATGRYLDALTHQPVTDATDLENAQVDRLKEPKDTSAADATRAATAENRLQAAREHAYSEMKDITKPLMDRIDRADKLETSLNQNSDIADSTIAEQLVTLTAGGNGSGIRISTPMIDQVLNKSRTRWADLEQSLKRWSVAPPDQQKNVGLFFTPSQREAIHDLGRAYRVAAVKARNRVLSYRSKVDDANTMNELNHVRTQLQSDLFEPADETTGGGGAVKPLTVDDVFKKYGPPPGAK